TVGGGSIVQLDPGSTLTDLAGITVNSDLVEGGGLEGGGLIVTGTTSTTDFEGTGFVSASNGTLEFQQLVDSTSATNFFIGSGAKLKFDSTVGTVSINPSVTFAGVFPVLDLSSTTLGNFHGVLVSFAAGRGVRLSSQTGVTFAESYNSNTNITTVTA